MCGVLASHSCESMHDMSDDPKSSCTLNPALAEKSLDPFALNEVLSEVLCCGVAHRADAALRFMLCTGKRRVAGPRSIRIAASLWRPSALVRACVRACVSVL
jgi:hypothetical protein